MFKKFITFFSIPWNDLKTEIKSIMKELQKSENVQKNQFSSRCALVGHIICFHY